MIGLLWAAGATVLSLVGVLLLDVAWLIVRDRAADRHDAGFYSSQVDALIEATR